MEATVVKIGTALGVKMPKAAIKDFNLKVGTKIVIDFIRNGKFLFKEKSKVREGWDAAFAKYALDGEDKLFLPEFLDLETDMLI